MRIPKIRAPIPPPGHHHGDKNKYDRKEEKKKIRIERTIERLR